MLLTIIAFLLFIVLMVSFLGFIWFCEWVLSRREVTS